MLTLDQKDRYSLLIIYEVGNIMTTLVKMDNILPLRGVSEDPNEKVYHKISSLVKVQTSVSWIQSA